MIRNFSISGIYRYSSGYPIAITATGCQSINTGTCMPNLNPAYTGSARINGGYGAKTQAVAFSTPYIDLNAFTLAPSYTLGNAPRISAAVKLTTTDRIAF